jgi:hypothetical protein
MYPGASVPPGHPLWAIYGWLFIKLIPVSNVAWRLNLASAVAGALTCGMIALLVSRIGMLAVGNISGFTNFSAKEQAWVRLVCGWVAGLGFGFDGCFWCKAVVADTWPLSLALFALAICWLTKWFSEPTQLRWLFAAVFVHGLTLVESQALIPATFGLPFLLALGNRKLGRGVFFGLSLLLWSFVFLAGHLARFGWPVDSSDQRVLIGLAGMATLTWAVQSFQTRGFFSEWKTAGICAILFIVGVSSCFLLPIFSMTNPPINWGYARTVEGFFHLLSRGQFEAVHPNSDFHQLLTQWHLYGQITARDFGVLYLAAAAMPFLCMHRISSRARRRVFGLGAVWFIMTLLMLVGLNMDRLSAVFMKPFFAASHLVLAVFSGCGLMLVTAVCARPAVSKSEG